MYLFGRKKEQQAGCLRESLPMGSDPTPRSILAALESNTWRETSPCCAGIGGWLCPSSAFAPASHRPTGPLVDHAQRGVADVMGGRGAVGVNGLGPDAELFDPGAHGRR